MCPDSLSLRVLTVSQSKRPGHPRLEARWRHGRYPTSVRLQRTDVFADQTWFCTPPRRFGKTTLLNEVLVQASERTCPGSVWT